MGGQDGGRGVGAGGAEAGGDEAGFIYLDPIQVLKRAPSSLAWRFFQFRKYEDKIDENRVFCRLCDGKRREDGLPYNSSTTSLTHHVKKEHAKDYEAAEKEDFKKATASKPPSVLPFLTAPQAKWSKSSEKWKAAKWCVKNTRPMQMVEFDDYSTTLGGNKFVTGSIVMPIMKSIQKHLSTSEDEPAYISNMKKIILEDFKQWAAKNLNYEFLIKASALDPRFRKLKFVEDKAKRELVFKKLQEEASEHVKEQQQAKVLDEMEEREGGLGEVKRRKLGLDYDESDEEQEEEDSAGDMIKREVDIHNVPIKSTPWNNYFIFYFSSLPAGAQLPSRGGGAGRGGHPEPEPRAAGQVQQLNWDVLNTILPFRKYLCVPATSTQAERVFSAMGWLLNKKRQCLSGSHVDEQLFLKENLLW
jgi:hypothetical protein